MQGVILFVCIVSVTVVALRCKEKFNKILSFISTFCFTIMLFIGLKNYPESINGVELHIMGISMILGLASTLVLIVKNWILKK